MWPGDLSLTSFNSLCIPETFCQHPSTFRAAVGPSVNICLLPIQPGDLLSTYVNFPCSRAAFYQYPSTILVARRYSVTFHAPVRTSINFREYSMRPGDFLSTSVNFTSSRETCHYFPSTFHALGDFPSTSVNFPCGRETSSTSVNFL